MSDSNAVALREGSDDLSQLERCRSQARHLELQVSRKEAELRRAKEEHALLKELRTVNELTLRKKQQTPEGKEGGRRLQISPESLAEIMALENEIKHENKRTGELQEAANLTSQQMENVEKGIEEVKGRVTVIKQSTGWETLGSTPKSVAATVSEHMDCKRRLTALRAEQQTVKSLIATLSERIEEITATLNAQREREHELTEAQQTLQQKNAEYEHLLGEVKSMERLTKKKERLLDASTGNQVDEYKVLKQMEGEKKVMYNNLSKLRETNVSNSKSIISLEVRLRQLETKLEAANLFLQQVFDEVEEEPMENVNEDATEVPLETFEELCGELEISRQTLLQREDQLNAHDAKVEQLERKTSILQNAIASRATSAQLQVKGKEKEFETLMSHVDYMKAEFDEEYAKLSRENTALRAKLS